MDKLKFRLTTKVQGWKAALAAIWSQANDEAIFEVREDGLFFKARDPSKVSMMSCWWKKELFSVFESDTFDKKIGFKVSDWKAIFSRFNKDAEVTLAWDGEGSVTIVSENKEFSAFLMHPDYLPDTSKIPTKLQESYDTTIETNLKDLQDIIEDIKLFSVGVEFNIKNNQLILSGGNESGKSRVIFPKEISGEARGKYQIEYLTGIARDMLAYSDKATIQVKTDYPLSILLNVPQLGEAQFYVAPMIESKQP